MNIGPYHWQYDKKKLYYIIYNVTKKKSYISICLEEIKTHENRIASSPAETQSETLPL